MHRHLWQRGRQRARQGGTATVYWRCQCGKRRVDTVGATGVVRRRYVVKDRNGKND